MVYFICPICAQPLRRESGCMQCLSGHNYDIAKSGYVNLLLSQSGKQHGDDKEMVRARHLLLEKGYYLPLLEKLQKLLEPLCTRKPVLLDAGCGEGWYSAGLYTYLCQKGKVPTLMGIDISKNALRVGARRCPQLQLAVASVYHLPVADSCCDIVLSIFSPLCAGEYHRVLHPGGFFIHIYPLEKHLWELKQAIYDSPVPNDKPTALPDGFHLMESDSVYGTILLDNPEDIQSLFAMTPYSHRTSPRDKAKLQNLQELSTQIAFGIAIYRRT